MALTEPDLDPGRGSILVRQGKGGKRREVGMDDWGFDQLQPWLARRLEMPVGTLFCVIYGQTRGRPWTPAAARNHLRRVSTRQGCGPASLPTSCATPRRRDGPRGCLAEGDPMPARPRQLGVTSVYLDGIDTAEIIDTVHNRQPPMISASAGLSI